MQDRNANGQHAVFQAFHLPVWLMACHLVAYVPTAKMLVPFVWTCCFVTGAFCAARMLLTALFVLKCCRLMRFQVWRSFALNLLCTTPTPSTLSADYSASAVSTLGNWRQSKARWRPGMKGWKKPSRNSSRRKRMRSEKVLPSWIFEKAMHSQSYILTRGGALLSDWRNGHLVLPSCSDHRVPPADSVECVVVD